MATLLPRKKGPFEGFPLLTGRNCGFFCRKRQTAVQSSNLEEGYLLFHAKAAASTTALAASFSVSAAYTIEETSSLLS
ncbi:hypothetical protein VIGAN_11179600, partial [Vigna angularis var. angularis]